MSLPDGVNPCIKAGSPGQALASALAGMGRTILPLALAEAAIARGALQVLEGPEDARRAYWLLAPAPQWRSKKVRALVAFLGS
jgi:LysR family glycine cleavage system transcriptional activator